MKDKTKYLILDFGLVLGKPKTGNWFITPNFYEIIEKNKIDLKRLNVLFNKYNENISKKIITKEEEYKAFKEFYLNILNELKIVKNEEETAEKLAEDFVYNEDKYIMYDDVYEFLEKQSQKYILILLSDNWPCVYAILKNWGIDKFFTKIYISSEYPALKKDGLLFDYAMNEFKIKKDEAIFVDDNPELLEVADKKKLIPVLMDRTNLHKDYSKYKRIQNLEEIKI